MKGQEEEEEEEEVEFLCSGNWGGKRNSLSLEWSENLGGGARAERGAAGQQRAQRMSEVFARGSGRAKKGVHAACRRRCAVGRGV